MWLFDGLLAQLAARDAVDRDYVAAHTSGFDAALAENGVTSEDIATMLGDRAEMPNK